MSERVWTWPVSQDSMPDMLKRLSGRFTPATVIDLGASDGRWSEMASEIWPEAKFLLIEANPAHAPIYADFAARRPDVASRFHYLTAMAGGEPGSAAVAFNTVDAYQGLVAVGPGDAIPVTTIDAEVKRLGLAAPYLIKFDTHGREHDILRGAITTLRNTGAMVIEVYTWALGPASMRMTDLCGAIDIAHGFLPSDWCEPMRRPIDGRMHQADMLFEPSSVAGMDAARFDR
jgi:FkbM family methyltransferase